MTDQSVPDTDQLAPGQTRQARLEQDEADRARIAARYPSQPALHRWLWLVAGLLALVGVVWTVWAGIHHSRPPVDADVYGFTVVDDFAVQADLRVQRTDPGRAAVCTVEAQAADFVRVGEVQATIPPGTEKITRQVVELKTVNRATTAQVTGCRVA